MGPMPVTFSKLPATKNLANIQEGAVLRLNQFDEQQLAAYQQRIRDHLRGNHNH